MCWNNSTQKWEPRVNNLDSLSNVLTTGKNSGDQLQWNNSTQKWEKFTPNAIINEAFYIVGYCTGIVNTFTLNTGPGVNYPSVVN